MPTLDPPGIEWGTGPGPLRSRPRRRVNPVALATVTFLAALTTTLLILVLTGAIRT